MFMQRGFQALFTVKIISLNNNLANIQTFQLINGFTSQSFRIISLTVEMLNICHWIAIAWNILQKIQILYEIEVTWQASGTCGLEPFQQYICSLKWATSTVMLVGSDGYNTLELVFSLIVIYVTVGVFANFLSSIILILEDSNQKRQERNHNMTVLNSYLRQNRIKKDLQEKIRNYIEQVNLSREELQKQKDINELLDKLPLYLKKTIKQELLETRIQSMEFFNQFSQVAKETLLKISEEEFYITNQQIFNTNIKENSIYLITQGQVEVYVKNKDGSKKFLLYKLKAGDVLEDTAFITGDKSKFQFKCCCYVSLLKIRRQDFLSALKGNSYDKELFYQVIHQVKLTGIYRSTQCKQQFRKCYICGMNYHTEYYCTQISARPCHIKAGIQSQKYSPNQRQRYYRRQYKRHMVNYLDDLSITLQIISQKEEFYDYLQDFQSYLQQNIVYQLVMQEKELQKKNVLDSFSSDSSNSDNSNSEGNLNSQNNSQSNTNQIQIIQNQQQLQKENLQELKKKKLNNIQEEPQIPQIYRKQAQVKTQIITKNNKFGNIQDKRQSIAEIMGLTKIRQNSLNKDLQKIQSVYRQSICDNNFSKDLRNQRDSQTLSNKSILINTKIDNLKQVNPLFSIKSVGDSSNSFGNVKAVKKDILQQTAQQQQIQNNEQFQNTIKIQNDHQEKLKQQELQNKLEQEYLFMMMDKVQNYDNFFPQYNILSTLAKYNYIYNNIQ